MQSNRFARQSGIGLVEVLVASVLMAVALVVLLGSLSSLLIGSRIAQRRTVEERLARNQIESLIALKADCPVPAPTPMVDGVTYKVDTSCPPPQSAGYVELKVTVHELHDPSDRGESLSIDWVQQ